MATQQKIANQTQMGLAMSPYFAKGIATRLFRKPYLPRQIVNIIAEYGTTSLYEILLMILETSILLDAKLGRDCNLEYYVPIWIRLIEDEQVAINLNYNLIGIYSIKHLIIFIESGYGIVFEASFSKRVLEVIRTELESRIKRMRIKLNTF